MSRRSRRRDRRRGRRRAAWLMAAAVVLATAVVVADPPERTPAPEPVQAAIGAVFPKVDSDIRFDHSRHAEVACTSCHAGAVASKRASESLVPPMAACAECHAADAEPTLASCQGCHDGYAVTAEAPVSEAADWQAVRPAPMPAARRPTRIRFDHAAHITRLVARGGPAATAEATCQGCHSADAAGRPSMPAMTDCTSCHDGARAPGTCQTCHPTAETGQIRTDFIDPTTGDTQRLMPTNHEVAWDTRHGAVARANPDACTSCHVEDDCSSCHDAVLAEPFAVHPPNFKVVHAVAARSQMGECTDCHDLDTFCTSCHVRLEVTAIPGNRPPPGRAVHPPGWLDATMPNNHGVMARREITECASCHVEDDCVACHRGVNPHPPGFTADCQRWLEANASACTKCHTDLQTLRMRCF